MPRIRSVKPEFWSSPQVAGCSIGARLLFIGMWNFCDDKGVHTADPLRLKMEVYPADPFTLAEVEAMITELIIRGLIVEYSANGSLWWQVTGWRHQKIDKPGHSPFPQLSDGNIVRGLNGQVQSGINSPTIPRTFDEHSTTIRSGEERIGEERKEGISPSSPPGGDGLKSAFDRFCAAYPSRNGSLGSRKAAEQKFLTLVKSGTDPEAIIAGAKRYAEWAEREGNAGTKFIAQHTTWLNQERWSEQYPETGTSQHANGQRKPGLLKALAANPFKENSRAN